MGYYTHATNQIGSFTVSGTQNHVEFSENNTGIEWGAEFPHIIWTSAIGTRGFRFAKILKTVAYVVVDEDDEGNPIIKKWDIKNFALICKHSLNPSNAP